jgi:uncharacterized membrane protein YeaQ/YmgE (transglycosylase-associated protein family)
MYLLLWIFVGWAAGWLAGRRVKSNGYGPSMDVSMGAAGGLIGGLLMRSIGFSGPEGTALSTLVAMTCAALLTTVAAHVNGRRIYSSQV